MHAQHVHIWVSVRVCMHVRGWGGLWLKAGYCCESLKSQILNQFCLKVFSFDTTVQFTLLFKTFYTNKKPKSNSKCVCVCEKCSGQCLVLILLCNCMREAEEYMALYQCKNFPSHGCSPTLNNNLQQGRQGTGQFLDWFILVGFPHLVLGYPMFRLPFGMYYTVTGECVYHLL
jgi:hypothetical protein